MTTARKTFLLVPGAWHGAWCYRRVQDLLEAKGFRVHALSLTGLADRSHLASDAVNMDTHIADVVNFVTWEDLNDFVLVGHSYGGLVVTGAAEKIGDRVSSIVYLDAFMPENGQSMADIVKREMPVTGFTPSYPAAAMGVLPEDAAWADTKLTPQPVNTYNQKMTLTGTYQKIAKKTYVRTLGFPNPGMQATYETFKQRSDWRTFTIDCGHDLMLAKPVETADLLAAAV
ncbi:MAG: alpha/beta fold hydrolase [Rhodopseudomonas sp.]|nr:alpha/beta fold hydrolase [Rhodopseudomonas sp.]